MDTAAWIGLAVLIGTVYLGILTTRSVLRAGKADLRYAAHDLIDNPNELVTGKQVNVTVLNRGDGTAFDPVVWLGPAVTGGDRPRWGSGAMTADWWKGRASSSGWPCRCRILRLARRSLGTVAGQARLAGG